MPLLLVDNDVLIKLAHWGLLDALPEIFGATWSDVASLSSLKFRAKRADKKLFRSSAVASDLAVRLEAGREIPEPDREVFLLIQGVPNIDAGEVELIGACAAHPEAILVTGDKRSLIALADPTLADAVERVKGRIYSLEQCLERIAALRGHAPVVDGILPNRDLDTTIRCIVGPGGCTEEALREGLQSYVRDLRAQTGTVLAPDFAGTLL